MTEQIQCAVLIVVLLLSAGDTPAAGERRGEMMQRAVIGRDSRLLAVQGIAVLPDGGVLVSDKLDYRVKKFAASGKQTAAVGGRGRGPGQFRGPGPIDVHRGKIAVADFGTARVQIFEEDLTPSLSFQAPGAISDLCFDGGGNLWVMVLAIENGPGLFQFDGTGRQRKALVLKGITGDPFLQAGFVAWPGKGVIAVSYYAQNKIEMWDTSGRFIREFSIPGLPGRARAVSGDLQKLPLPEGNIFRSMAADGHGRMYLLGADYSDKPGQEILELDLTGTLRRRISLPDRCVLIRADRKGSLYVVPRARNSVVRYQLERD